MICPLLPAFFSKFPIISWNIVLALSFCHLSFLFPCPFFLFLLFSSARALFSWYFFPIRPYLFPPPRGGGIFQYIDPCLLDPDPDSESGSTDPIEHGSNPDPDPQPWLHGMASVGDPWHFGADPYFWLMDPDPAQLRIRLISLGTWIRVA